MNTLVDLSEADVLPTQKNIKHQDCLKYAYESVKLKPWDSNKVNVILLIKTESQYEII